jgi:hypothetical protein
MGIFIRYSATTIRVPIHHEAEELIVPKINAIM